MRTSLMLAVCALFVAGCDSAALTKVESSDEALPKFCTDDTDKSFKLPVGEQAASVRGTCMLVKCKDVVDGKSIFTAIGCGVFVPTVGCNATDYDYSKRYPDCCPSETCNLLL